MRAIFLDKDGTLVEDVPYNVNPELVVLGPRVAPGLRLLRQHGYALFMVSNQSGIAKGMFSEPDLRCLLQHLDRLLKQEDVRLDGFYYCPHSPDGSVAAYAIACSCRKPLPGLIRRAAYDHGVDLARSWMVGDILHDVEAGHRAGCKTVLIDNGNETQWQRSPLRIPDMTAPDVYAAAEAIILADSLYPSTTATVQ
jgi:D-glycero-D-manno-heptose 1,7-bisphosphate phosphatase